MFHGFSTMAVVDYVLILLLVLEMMYWTWRGCLRHAEVASGAEAALAASFHRFRWIALLLLIVGVFSFLLPGVEKARGTLLTVALSYLFVEFIIGYGGFLLRDRFKHFISSPHR